MQFHTASKKSSNGMTTKLYVYQILAEDGVGEELFPPIPEVGCAADPEDAEVRSGESELFEAGGEAEFEWAELAAAKAAAADIDPTKP